MTGVIPLFSKRYSKDSGAKITHQAFACRPGTVYLPPMCFQCVCLPVLCSVNHYLNIPNHPQPSGYTCTDCTRSFVPTIALTLAAVYA